QPVHFETKHFELLEKEDYFVRDKTGGKRYIMFFTAVDGGTAFMARFLFFFIFRKNLFSKKDIFLLLIINDYTIFKFKQYRWMNHVNSEPCLDSDYHYVQILAVCITKP